MTALTRICRQAQQVAKAVLTSCALLFFSTMVCSAQPYDPDSLTIALYHLNEAMGSTARDATSNGLDAIVVGATWTSEGKFGGAVIMDGDDVIETAQTGLLRGAGDITLEAWVYRTSDVASMILDTRALSFPFPDGRTLTIDPEGQARATASLSHIGIWWARSTSPIPLNTWVHLAGVFSESEAKVRIIVNGVIENESFLFPGVGGAGANAATIGRSRFGTPEFIAFIGKLDEVRISHASRYGGRVSLESKTWGAIKAIWK